MPDGIAPVITLVGNSPQTIIVGGTYTELGATASDNVDGDISANIAINATAVNTATLGSYSVRYNVSDAAGNAASPMNRTVSVVAAAVSDPEEESSGGGGGSVGMFFLFALLLMKCGFRYSSVLARRRALPSRLWHL